MRHPTDPAPYVALVLLAFALVAMWLGFRILRRARRSSRPIALPAVYPPPNALRCGNIIAPALPEGSHVRCRLPDNHGGPCLVWLPDAIAAGYTRKPF